MDRLPAELRSLMCTFLGPSELVSFSLASSECLGLARWQLYTNVTLRSDSPSREHTFRLLQNEPALARRVLTLNVDTDEKWCRTLWSGDTWIDLGMFKGMAHLRTLRFRRLPCVVTNDDEAAEFVDILDTVYQNCKNLTQIDLLGFWWPQLPLDWYLPARDFGDKIVTRPKLTKVVYNARSSTGVNWTFLMSSLFTPSSSITYLDFFIGNGANHFSVLHTLSFPTLRTLYLRSVQRAGMSSIATFLVSHPSIRHLFLIHVDRHLPQDKLDIAMLPRLQTIYAPPLLLAQLGEKCESLHHVKALVLDYSDVNDCVRETAELVRKLGGFPDLLHFSIAQVIASATTADIVRLFAAESTQLTCWTGGFYYRDCRQLKMVTHALTSFPALARLDICEWTHPITRPTAEQFGALSYIARKNPALLKISLYMVHLSTKEISTMYRVERRTAHESRAELKETYRSVEGGPYMMERRRIDYTAVEWEDEVPLGGAGW